MKITFAPDLPIRDYTQDHLKSRDFAATLQNAIYNTRPPFAFGILGDWGSGKTSILNLLYHLIDRDQRSGVQPFVPILFEAWKYENEENLIYPLLKAIRDDYYDEENKAGRANLPTSAFLSRFKEIALTSTLALADCGLRAATKAILGDGVSLEDIAKHYKSIKEHEDPLETILSGWTDEVKKLDKSFKALLQAYANDLHAQGGKFPADQYRFVILIDDLDRCLPQTTIDILENIKNYLSAENCIFVLALNPSVIYQGIRIKYAGLQVDGRQYLEKILNYSFYVPDPSLEHVQEFAERQLLELVDPADRDQLKVFFMDFSAVIRDCQFTNPRKVKRILNHFLYFLETHEKQCAQYQMQDIIKFIVLAEYFPEIFQLFLEDAKRARTRFGNITTDGFMVKDFENQTGISLSGSFSQLRKMHQLFNLSDSSDLTKYAKLVYQIVHHPV